MASVFRDLIMGSEFVGDNSNKVQALSAFFDRILRIKMRFTGFFRRCWSYGMKTPITN
jgi:hypothetical protein